MEIKTGTEAQEIMALLRDVLKAKLFVDGRLAKPIFMDSLKTGTLDPIAAIAVLYMESKPVAWTVRTSEDWRTGYEDSGQRAENEIWWRFTTPDQRQKGFCTMLKQTINSNINQKEKIQ
jgi:hypothetical protein